MDRRYTVDPASITELRERMENEAWDDALEAEADRKSDHYEREHARAEFVDLGEAA